MDKTIGNDVTIRPKAERGTGAFAPGDVMVGRYVVEKVLGEGGMGIVYQCLDRVGGVAVAVKCLPPEVSRNADEMEDIRANYRLVADLHHPNIAGARTLELDETTGDYYLVMDLARGVSLKRWARGNPQATTEAKLAILRQVAAALDYAHAEKVIHRDVKPENVMVDDDGRVKVLDFGLAAQIRSSQSRTSNTVTSKGGTPGYKSPEQWLGRPQQVPADVYAFGVMAYWLFSDRLPFECDDPAVLGHAVLSAPVEPIPDLPAHMNAALVKALAKKPENRFASCTAFVDALEGSSAAHMVGSGRAVAPRPPQGGSRSRATALLIVAALILAIAGGWWYYRQEQLREQQRRAAESARQKTAAEEAKRKAEEEARERQAATDKAKRKAEEERQKALAELARRIAKASAMEIRVKALEQQSAVRDISDEDGFKAKKDDLDKDFARADALFDEKAECWSDAAVLFTNYVAGCKALLTLDGERRTALEARTKAEEAKDSAEKAEAKNYAPTCWRDAVRSLASAKEEFARMQFVDAERSFASAEKQFGVCVTDAQAEKKRQEDAAAQAQAEEAARERERRAKRIEKYERLCREYASLLRKEGKEVSKEDIEKEVERFREFSEAKQEAEIEEAERKLKEARERAEAAARERERRAKRIGKYERLCREYASLLRKEGKEVSKEDIEKEVERFKKFSEAKQEAEIEEAERKLKEAKKDVNKRKEGEEFTINDPYGLYMTMKWCPAGSFTMGSPASEDGRDADETQHRVTFTKGFWLGQTEVTQGQWKKIMNGETIIDLARKALQDDTEYTIAGKMQTIRDFYKKSKYDAPTSLCVDVNENAPVYNVNWHEAVEFCRRLTQRERAAGRIPDGYEYRLPTEAEWEYACRAGTTESLPNGRDIRILGRNNAPALDDIAWYGGNSSVGFKGRGWDTSNLPEKQYRGEAAAPREVKGKQPNNWGLFDMIGNVWEWCGDWYGNYGYGNQTDPVGPAKGALRVFRGGSWNGWLNDDARCCRSANRGGSMPGFRINTLGFRVALAPRH